MPGPAVRLGAAGVAMIGVSYGFARYGYGLFEPDLRAEFGLSIADSGVVAGVAYVGYVAAVVLTGVLARRLGPRPLIAAAGSTATAGMAVVVLASTPWQLVAGLVVAGASSGFAWAPYSDAVDHLVAPGRRTVVLAAIASGTSVGITVAAVLALVASGTQWRAAWVVFVVLAALATVPNVLLLRRAPGRGRTRRTAGSGLRSQRSLRRPGTLALYATAVAYGAVGSVYWTFAVAAVSGGGDGATPVAQVFWGGLGVAGTLGIGAGVLFTRWGLRRSHTLLLGGLAVATVLVAVVPGSWAGVGVSAAVYGPAFMATSGLLAVWSYEVFPDAPAGGFSATLLALGLGSVAGPALAGALADGWGTGVALLAFAAVITGAALVARPPARFADPRTAVAPPPARP